jgi:hypothetical protein
MTEGTPRSDRTAARPPPLPGEAAAVGFGNREDTATDAAADMDDNELHAAGQVCSRCHGVIGPEEAARRHLDGTFQHEICP